MASAAMQAVDTIGLPEVQIILAHVTAYLACAPKSNASYKAIAAALKDVAEQPVQPVPNHLRGTGYKGAEELGHVGYEYAHDGEGAWVDQVYMTEPKKYYIPTDRGAEAKLKEYLDRLDQRRKKT
jgi:putative ATPase